MGIQMQVVYLEGNENTSRGGWDEREKAAEWGHVVWMSGVQFRGVTPTVSMKYTHGLRKLRGGGGKDNSPH